MCKNKQSSVGPLVSVIMPNYNSARFVECAIRSVLSQTYLNIELIICDDQSSDDSPNIIQDISRLDSRVITVRNNFGKGASGARNSCLAVASGEFIAFLDSDDFWQPRKIEIQLDDMLKRSLDFSYSSYQNISEDGQFISDVRAPVRFSPLFLRFSNFIGCLTVVYRRSAFPAVVQPSIRVRNDYALWLSMLSGISVERVGGVRDCLACYRVNSYGLSSSKLSALLYFYKVHRLFGSAGIYSASVYAIGYLFFIFFKKKLPKLYNYFIDLVF